MVIIVVLVVAAAIFVILRRHFIFPYTNLTTTNPYPVVQVQDILASPAQYDGQAICIEGYYQSGWEFGGMGNREMFGGIRYPLILAGPAKLNPRMCWTGHAKVVNCFGRVRSCGIFLNKPVYEASATYQYQLQYTPVN